MVEQFRMPEPPFVIQERRDIPHMDVVRASDYAALEALCRELERKVHLACNQFENITVAETLEIAKDRAHGGVAFTMETACEHHWMPATQAGSLAIIGRGCSKCGAWETSPEPNYRFQEPSNLPSQSMTIGAHPGGGPCIHVWALTNRDAVENGRCGICGQSVANRSVKP